MAQASNFGVTTTISIDGIGDIFPSPSSTSAPYQLNNNPIQDGIQVVGTSSSSIPFSPLSDTEIRRRARNNAILAKIQELEANASIQAARSERLKMMREEYESLVRKYASNRKWNWGLGSSSNGFLNGSTNGHTYLPRYNGASSHHQPFIAPFNAPGPQLHQTSSPGSNENQFPHPARDLLNGHINRSFTTKGVNTEITGPVRPAVLREYGTENDLVETRIQAQGKKVKVIIDTESQTEDVKGTSHFEESEMIVSPHSEQPRASSSSTRGNFIFNGREKPNHKVIGDGSYEIKEVSSTSAFTSSKNLSSSTRKMMMLDDEEEDDDESLLEKHERKRKLQLEEFYQQPKAFSRKLNDSGSIITSDEGTDSKSRLNTNNDGNVTMSNTTDEGLLKLGQRQKLEQMKEKTAVERLEVMAKKKRNEEIEEDSVDDSTFSFANDRKGAGAEYGGGGGGVGGLTDLSLSDSVSVLQQEQRNENRRKKLLEQIGASSSSKNEASWKGKSKPAADSDDESSNEEEDKSVIRFRMARKYAVDEDDDDPDEPTTVGGGGGATSESLGDSFMDSIHKTPDTFPKEESELHEIKEVREEAKAEIKFPQKAATTFQAFSDDDEEEVDEVLVVTATAASIKALTIEEGNASEPRIPLQSGVNDKLSEKKTEIALKRSNSEFEDEDYQKKQINDAEEIRSNNLSSSEFDVPAEQVEGISDANTVGNNVIQKEENGKEKEILGEFYEDVEQGKKDGFLQSEENEIATKAAIPVEKDMISHSPAPSANMSAHSSSSSFTSSNVVAEGDRNGTEIHEKNASKKEIQRESSTDSSSSSSRQHSLDEQAEGNTTEKTNEKSKLDSQNVSDSDAKLQDNSASTLLAQSMHKRHQQLEEQVKEKQDEKEASPPAVGAEIMPERISSSVSSSSEGTKVNVGEKTAKGSAAFHQSTTNASSSPSSSKRTSSSRAPGDSGKGNGMTGGVSNIRSSTTRSFKSTGGSGSGGGIPSKPSSPATTKHVGPKGAQNTAKRVLRLKLNYDDSESDSSEIGPVKSRTEDVTGNAMNVSGRNAKAGIQPAVQKPTSSINANNGKQSEKNENSQKSVEDDDFDDFFDM